MVRRLHAGNLQDLPALCLGKDATFETNVTSDAIRYLEIDFCGLLLSVVPY